MDRSDDENSYYTSFWDATFWSLKFIGGVILLAAVIAIFKEYIRDNQHAVTSKVVLATVLVAISAGLLLGSLMFFFGWLGQVTISRTGIKAPRYSGRRVFLSWDKVQTAQKGSLGGWPCILVCGSDSKPLYLMVIGEAQQRMIECIRACAVGNNALTRYLTERSV